MSDGIYGTDYPDLELDEDGNAVDSAYVAELEHNRAVSEALRGLKVRRDAQERLRAESEPHELPFDGGTLRELLARPAEPPARVEGLIPWEASTLLTAMRKTGKTTFVLNLAYSLLTGRDFLGRFKVRPIEGTVGLLNYEVSSGMISRWAEDHGIDPDRLYISNLRGRRNPLPHPGDRARLARELRQHHVETLIVDPFGKAYSGESQNDSGQVGAWLADLDRFARAEVYATDLILTAHAGWAGERTRGSSALEDWADSIITLTRDAEDDTQRFMRAIGRDVEVDEDRLNFDPDTRTLTLAGVGSRKHAASTRHIEELLPAVLDAVSTSPGVTGYGLDTILRESGVQPFHKGDGAKAARLGVERGHLHVEDGPRNSKRFHPLTSPTSPPPPRGDITPPPPPPYKGEVGGGEVDQHSPPQAGEVATCDTCSAPLLLAVAGRTTCGRCEDERRESA